jgi:hypothetical protein
MRPTSLEPLSKSNRPSAESSNTTNLHKEARSSSTGRSLKAQSPGGDFLGGYWESAMDFYALERVTTSLVSPPPWPRSTSLLSAA